MAKKNTLNAVVEYDVARNMVRWGYKNSETRMYENNADFFINHMPEINELAKAEGYTINWTVVFTRVA